MDIALSKNALQTKEMAMSILILNYSNISTEGNVCII